MQKLNQIRHLIREKSTAVQGVLTFTTQEIRVIDSLLYEQLLCTRQYVKTRHGTYQAQRQSREAYRTIQELRQTNVFNRNLVDNMMNKILINFPSYHVCPPPQLLGFERTHFFTQVVPSHIDRLVQYGLVNNSELIVQCQH